MTAPTSLFSRLRGSARRGIWIEGLGLVLAGFVAFMLISFALDRTLRLEEVYRVSLLVLLLGGAWWVTQRYILGPLGVDLTDDELALAVERGESDLAQSLISAVQFERSLEGGGPVSESTDLMRKVVSDVHARIDGIRDETALDTSRVRRFLAVILACLAVVGTWALTDSESLALWARRNLLMSDEDWPRASQLAFVMDHEGGVVRVAHGDDLTVEVHATGQVIPEQVYVHYRFGDGISGREPMALTGDADSDGGARFTWLMEQVLSPATLYATGGDGLSQDLRIEVVERPMLLDLAITKHYPAYMNREPERVPPGEGDLRVPAGVRLDFAGNSSKELEKAFLTFGREAPIGLDLASDRRSYRGSFAPQESGVLTLDVLDRDRLGSGKPPKLFLRVVEDRAPMVDYKTQGIGSMVLFKALIPGSVRFRDDFGLTRVAAAIRITREEGDAQAGAGTGEDAEVKAPPAEAAWEDLPLTGLRQPDGQGTEQEYELPIVFDLASRNDITKSETDPSLAIRPGMLLQIRFSATDNYGPEAPHTGTSEVVTVRVVTEDKLMQDLHRRQVERRREVEQILQKEKDYELEIGEIISPTANDPKASLARLRLQAIARDQRALQKQVLGVADRYRLILDEYANNRILKPSQIIQQRQAIEEPLERLGREDFPTSAQEVEDFSQRGIEELRQIAVASYEAIVRDLEEIIRNMAHLESVAGIIEEFRKIRQMEESVRRDAAAALEKEDAASRVAPPREGPEKEGSEGGSGSGSGSAGGGVKPNRDEGNK
jgi:hypothetical protein